MLNLFRKLKLPLILLVVLLVPLFLGEQISAEVKSFLYAVSLSIKGILLTILPFIIFSFVFSCLLSLKGRVLSFALSLIALVFCSNYVAIMFGYSFGKAMLSGLSIASEIVSSDLALIPAWEFDGIKIISNEMALILGFVLGIYFSIRRNQRVEHIAELISKYANTFLKRFFLPVLPLFILGFVFKMEHEQTLNNTLGLYGPVFLIFAAGQALYTLLVFALAAGFRPTVFLQYIKNILPAWLTGLTTMSSAATMPFTIIAAEKNTGNSHIARMIIPATVNIHMIGTAVGLNILILASAITFGHPIPPLSMYLVFALFYALAQFAAAGVPGGVIIIMAPLLETYLGYPPEMVGLATALCLLFDSVDTSFNVSGNGAFAIIFAKVFGKKLIVDQEKLQPSVT